MAGFRVPTSREREIGSGNGIRKGLETTISKGVRGNGRADHGGLGSFRRPRRSPPAKVS